MSDVDQLLKTFGYGQQSQPQEQTPQPSDDVTKLLKTFNLDKAPPPPIVDQNPFQTIMSSSQDIPSDTAKLHASAILGRSMNVPTSEIWSNWDLYTQKLYGKTENPASVLDKLRGSIKDFQLQNERSAIGTKKLFGTATQADMQRDEELKSQQNEPRARLSKIPNTIFQMVAGLGYMGFTGASTVADWAAAGIATATLGARLAQPSVEAARKAQEEFLGNFMGGLYSQARDAGVSIPVARGVSLVVGALEAAFFAVPISRIPGISKLFGESLQEAAARIAVNGSVDRVLGTVAARYGGRIAGMQALNTVYATANVMAPELAKALNNKIQGTTLPLSSAKDILEQIGIQSTTMTGIMGIAGVPGVIREGSVLDGEVRRMVQETSAKTETGEPTAPPVEKIPALEAVSRETEKEIRQQPISDIMQSEPQTATQVEQAAPSVPTVSTLTQRYADWLNEPQAEGTAVEVPGEPTEAERALQTAELAKPEEPTPQAATQKENLLTGVRNKVLALQDALTSARKEARGSNMLKVAALEDALKSAQQEYKLGVANVQATTKASVEAKFARAAAREQATKEVHLRIANINAVFNRLRSGKIPGGPSYTEPLRALEAEWNPTRKTGRTLASVSQLEEALRTDPDSNYPDDWLSQLKEIAHKSSDGINLDDLQKLEAGVRHLAKLARDHHQMWLEGKQTDIEQANNEVTQEFRKAEQIEATIRPRQPGEEITSKETAAVRRDRLVKSFVTRLGLRSRDMLVRAMFNGGEGSKAFRLIIGNLVRDENKLSAFVEAYHTYPGKWFEQSGKKVSAWFNERSDVGPFNLSRDERIAFYQHSLLENNRDSITNPEGGFALVTGPKAYQIERMTPEELQTIVSSLTDEEKSFAKALEDGYDRMGADLQKTFLEENDFELPILQHYMPKETVPEGRSSISEQELEEALARGRFSRAGAEKGHLKTRTGATGPIFVRGAMRTYLDALDNAAVYNAMEHDVRNAGKLVYDARPKGFKDRVVAGYGSKVWQALDRHLKDAVRMKPDFDRSLESWRGGTIRALLYGNFKTAFRLAALQIRSLAYIDPLHWFMGVGENFVHPRAVNGRTNFYSQQFRSARAGFMPEIAEAMSTELPTSKVGRPIGKATRVLGKPIAIGNRFGIAGEMNGAHYMVLSEIRKGEVSPRVGTALDLAGLAHDEATLRGLSGDEAMKYAYTYGEYVANRTHAVTLPEFQSILSRRSEAGRWVSALGSEGNAAYNAFGRMLDDARQDARRYAKNGQPKKAAIAARQAAAAARWFIVFGVIASTVDYGINNGFAALGTGRKEKWWEAFAGDVSETWYGARDVEYAISNTLRKTWQQSSANLFLIDDVASWFVQGIHDAYMAANGTGPKKAEYAWRAFDNIASAASTVIRGFPYRPVRNLATMLVNAVSKAEKTGGQNKAVSSQQLGGAP